MMAGFPFIFIVCLCLCCILNTVQQSPYNEFVKFLQRTKVEGCDLSSKSTDEIARAVSGLSSSQSTLKTFDGITHKFTNSLSDKSTLHARLNTFLKGRKKNTKEAAKILEYVNVVERGLQASEILNGVVSMNPEIRERKLADSGLTEVKRVKLGKNKIQCVLSIMLPVNDAHFFPETAKTYPRGKPGDKPRFFDGELVIAISDDPDYDDHISRLLRVLAKGGEQIELQSVGLLAEDVTVHPTLLGIASDALREVAEFIFAPIVSSPPLSYDINGGEAVERSGKVVGDPSLSDSNRQKDEFTKRKKEKAKGLLKRDSFVNRGSATKKTTKLKRKEILLRTSTTRSNGKKKKASIIHNRNIVPDVTIRNGDNHSSAPSILNTTSLPSRYGTALPLRVRLVGYSAGGAVATYMTAVLDGSLNSTDFGLEQCSECVGTYRSAVQALVLGPPPCLGRSLVPQCVTSIICGDDIVPRASAATLKSAQQRVYASLQSVLPGWLGMGISDLALVAKKGLNQYAAGKHDLTSLQVPGRVFFIKAREYKKGASIQRVFRGNWREDMLWLLHEVLISKRMQEHHYLDSHIRILSRC